MTDRPATDAQRTIVLVASAIFMVAANAALGIRIVEVGDESLPTPIDPAGYAFFIWGVIFLLGLVTAVYQARPANRERPLMRSVGWSMAAAFALTGLWPVLIVAGRPNLAHLVLFVMAVLLAVTYLRIAGAGDGRSSDWWGVAIPVAVPLGWLTAANAVSLASRGLDSRVLAPGPGANVVSAALLIAAGCIAGWLIRRGQAGPTALWAAYAATITWGVVAIIVNQWNVAPLGVIAAICAAVAAALIGWFGGGRPRPSWGRS